MKIGGNSLEQRSHNGPRSATFIIVREKQDQSSTSSRLAILISLYETSFHQFSVQLDLFSCLTSSRKSRFIALSLINVGLFYLKKQNGSVEKYFFVCKKQLRFYFLLFLCFRNKSSENCFSTISLNLHLFLSSIFICNFQLLKIKMQILHNRM